MTLDEINAIVGLEVQGCPIFFIDKAIIRAARDFCRIGIWEVLLPNVVTVIDQRNYPVVVPSDAELSRITSARYKDENGVTSVISELDLDQADHFVPSWQEDTGATTHYTWVPSTIDLYPLPKVAGELITLRVSLIPTLASTVLPDILLPWQETIAEGALVNLLTMASKPWGNIDAAMAHKRVHRKMKSQATGKMLTGHSDRSLLIKSRRFV